MGIPNAAGKSQKNSNKHSTGRNLQKLEELNAAVKFEFTGYPFKWREINDLYYPNAFLPPARILPALFADKPEKNNIFKKFVNLFKR